jgi:hypothetical protein
VTRHIRGRLLIVVAIVGVVCLTRAWPRATAKPPAGEPVSKSAPPENHGWDPAVEREATWIGVGGCASSSCHHWNGPKGSKQSEYDTWAAYDKHARAYQVLYNERSQRIARNLYGEGSKPANEQPLCLKCHASHDGVTDKGVGERFQLADGVGCESCHGPAEKWLTAHYQSGFKGKSLEEKAAFGLRPTKDILHRAKLCTSCHVGSPDKEVNHDLIAAGHPRLSFELGAYHGIYNKHWNIEDDHARYKDFESRLWSIGQLLSAKAALELLEARAEGATKAGKDAKPWPEFSEYDCFACHKQLQVDSPRQKAGYPDRRPGALPWGDWYLSPTNPLTGNVGMRGADDSDTIKKLRDIMQSPTPDSTKVVTAARETIRRIDGVLGGLQSNRPESFAQVRGFLDQLLRVGTERAKAMSWDEAAQLYLGLAAMQNELSDLQKAKSDPAVRDRLEKMARTLQKAFPAGSDSPSLFNPAVLDTDLKSIRAKIGD